MSLMSLSSSRCIEWSLTVSSALIFTIARVFMVVALPVCLSVLAGCNPGSGSRPVSLGIWQTQMQAWVVDQANGDMNALRNLHIAPGIPGFRVFSHDRPEQSRDFVGVLLGIHKQSDQIWYVYLIGDLDRERVTAMNLAAVMYESGQFTWQIGEDDARGSDVYRAYRERNWDAAHSSESLPRYAMGFPSPCDNFVMRTADGVISVVDQSSSASWTLKLNVR